VSGGGGGLGEGCKIMVLLQTKFCLAWHLAEIYQFFFFWGGVFVLLVHDYSLKCTIIQKLTPCALISVAHSYTPPQQNGIFSGIPSLSLYSWCVPV
jgi:hypothetical protein